MKESDMKAPVIDRRIFEIAPDFRAVSIHVDATAAGTGSLPSSMLEDAYNVALSSGPPWAQDHLASWAEVYSRFGAKPNRAPSSAAALRQRVIKNGPMPSINPVVDLYNAVSIRFALPVGGENLDAYAGAPHLTIADGTEPFDTVANGEPVTEHPLRGEVVWRDELGVTCRRWNWRQGIRTRLEPGARRMWFVLEALGTMPDDGLDAAADMLTSGLTSLLPGCRLERDELRASP